VKLLLKFGKNIAAQIRQGTEVAETTVKIELDFLGRPICDSAVFPAIFLPDFFQPWHRLV